MPRSLLLLTLLAVLSACIVEAPSSEKSAPARAPGKPVPVKNGAILGDGQQIELVGATFLPPSVTPGDSTRVALVFRALQPLTENWEIFVHVEDAEGRRERMNVDHPPAGRPAPGAPERWSRMSSTSAFPPTGESGRSTSSWGCGCPGARRG